jgi:hypothetical protein
MNFRIETRKTVASLEMLQAGVVQAIGLTMRSAIKAAEDSAKGTTLWKDRSGETRASIKGVYLGVAQGGFVTAGGASKFLENGTPPHVIRGKPILRFEVAGQVFYRRVVRHPGTAERPFMAEARRVGEQAALYGADVFIGAAIARTR